MKNILARTVSSLASCPWPKGQGLALLLLCLPALSPAIELSLEENRAQRGNIGYVDMQRLFKLYPETIRAKENFEEVVRQAEDQVNLKRAEIIRSRAEIAQLKIDREALAKAAPPPAAPAPSAPKVEASTAAPLVEISSAAAALPELSVTTGPVSVSMEGLPALPAPAAPAPSAALPLPMAAPAAPPPAPPSPLAELEEKLARKTKELEQKETDFKDYQASAEKNLLDLESRRTEILLGKINKAVKAVAKREGISVIVDKGSILFGHDAVDLTEKVLKELKGA